MVLKRAHEPSLKAFNDGSWARFKTMLADGATNPDPWVQDNDSHHLNIRQLYVEMGNFAEFTGQSGYRSYPDRSACRPKLRRVLTDR